MPDQQPPSPSDDMLPTDGEAGSGDVIADAAMVPMDDAAGGPSVDTDTDTPSEEEAAAQLGDFA